ncbi:hypothetical protein FACS1894164_17150 [Spirochaetia bacterium]|nr:hypothetical protein FACS1894164_17150 [Spirochaetia bacterium]
MTDELKNILENNNFIEYIDLFESNKIFDISTFFMLDDSDLEKMGVLAVGDRKRLLALANINRSVESNVKELVVYNAREQKKENIEEDHSYLKAAFLKINDNIDDLFEMKDQIKGFLIFKTHKYSVEQLLNSTQYRRIKSYIGKIEDDIQRWKQAGELTFSLRNTYNVNRDLLIDRLEDLEEAIENREPTWWESVQNFFIKILAFIAEHLPALWNGLMIVAEKLKNHKILGAPAKVLLNLNKTVQKFIISKKNIYITDET